MQKIYYNRELDGDILHVILDDKIEANFSEEKSDIVVYKNGEKIVAIDFLNISKIMRIFHSGEIEEPSMEFIAILNHMLKNAGIDICLG